MTPNPVLEWSLDHIHWPFIVAAAWVARGWVTDAINRAKKVETSIDHVMTNFLPHIQESMQNMDKNLAILVERDRNKIGS
jgi:hypothetical protein